MWDSYPMHFTPAGVGWGFSIYLIVLIVYYFFIGRTILSMLRQQGHAVLLTFACIALLPVPPTIVMGIVLMIIWGIHSGGR